MKKNKKLKIQDSPKRATNKASKLILVLILMFIIVIGLIVVLTGSGDDRIIGIILMLPGAFLLRLLL